MKKIVFLSVLLYTFCSQNLFGWGREGHDAVAYIAECNLNKKAKKIIESYLDGHSIVYYSSWMDDYRHTPEYKHTTVWHMASVDESLHYTDAVKAPEGDAVCELENAIKKLENQNYIYYTICQDVPENMVQAIWIMTCLKCTT